MYLCERLHFVLPAFHVVGVVDVVDENYEKTFTQPAGETPASLVIMETKTKDMDVRDYIAAHRERFMEEWASLLRIPSVSCQEEHRADMLRCAERWRELLLEAGAQRAEIMPSAGNSFVYGE